jgi:ribosome maturation factor RimP
MQYKLGLLDGELELSTKKAIYRLVELSSFFLILCQVLGKVPPRAFFFMGRVLDIRAKLLEVAENIAQGKDIEIVDLDYFSAGHRKYLKIFLHKEGGVTVGDCADFSREIGAQFDIEEVIDGQYNLEVSSPGLDRPLKTDRDFARNIGKRLNITYSDEDNKTRKIFGLLKSSDQDKIGLVLDDQSECELKREQVLMAKIDIQI